VSTLTLAEMYARQGLHGRAREILRRLSAQGDPEAQRKLAEMGNGAGREIELLERLLARIQEARGER
jgi:Fe2+ transport system protein FeoA